MVFGNTVKKAQIDMLSYIPANSSVVIIGGGTGWIIDEITKIHPAGLKIIYVDSSSKMIELSKKRNLNKNLFEFIQAPIENVILTGQKYDVIITPFLFDGFSQSKCKSVFEQLESYLKKGGLWLYSDFYLYDKSKYWQKIMIRLMYMFFRLTCKIEATKLPLMDVCFSSYELIRKKTYCKNFIITQVFQK